MIVFVGLGIALAAALIVTLSAGKRGGWKSSAALFAVVFLSVWSLGLWMAPFGPNWGGVYWLSFLYAGIVVALLAMALAPPPPRSEQQEKEEAQEEVEEAEGVGVFFWILAVIAIVMIFLKYSGNWLPSIR